MKVVDIHTHMLSEDYVELLFDDPATPFTTRTNGDGSRTVFRDGVSFKTMTSAMFDYEDRIRDMDASGVDVAVISLSNPNVYFDSEERSVRAAQIINRSMADACRRFPGRLKFLASVPWHYPLAAKIELERAFGDGAAGVVTLGNICGLPLTDDRFVPIWQELDKRGAPVFIHPSVPPAADQLNVDKYHMVFTVGFVFDTTLALTRMIMSGFFDRFPSVKVIAAHAGGALPFVLPRLDKGFTSFELARESISKLPSSYRDRIFVDSIAYSPQTLQLTVDTFGSTNVLFGTDYPHKCGDMSEMKDLVGQLGRSAREPVLGGNAAALFADLSA